MHCYTFLPVTVNYKPLQKDGLTKIDKFGVDGFQPELIDIENAKLSLMGDTLSLKTTFDKNMIFTGKQLLID